MVNEKKWWNTPRTFQPSQKVSDDMPTYFTDRENGAQPRTVDVINERLWGGLYTLINTRLHDGGFGYRFPEQCRDGNGPCGCDSSAFGLGLAAEVPNVCWPLNANTVPATPDVMDLLEFCASSVGEPIQDSYHEYYKHHHLSWNKDQGLANFVQAVNVIFVRNGIAYELTDKGHARRLLPQPFAEMLGRTLFKTEDAQTNQLLELARQKIASHKPEDRQDALEKLWDAFERLKTHESGSDKKTQANKMLNKVEPADPKFHKLLADEASALTEIGNTFCIRHFETNQENLTAAAHVDYVFMRMFAFIEIILKSLSVKGKQKHD